MTKPERTRAAGEAVAGMLPQPMSETDILAKWRDKIRREEREKAIALIKRYVTFGEFDMNGCIEAIRKSE